MHLWPTKNLRDSFKLSYLKKLEWNYRRMETDQQSSTEQKLLDGHETQQHQHGHKTPLDLKCQPNVIASIFQELLLVLSCCYCCFCCGVATSVVYLLEEMDEIFGYMDGRLEVSLADSTMMWIVHYAMNKAQERMKTKTGVIERLNEISKFYELAVMQLEGCLSFVQAETESSIHESKHDDVLTDLREIKDRLQWRLEECELAISEKDRELSEGLENELKLRHALELKEGESVSSSASHHDHQTKINEHGGDGDFSELRTCVDQQMMNIRQRLEPQHDMVGEVLHNGIDRKKVEEMGSDIDILKQTMDLAFGKMQSTLHLCEMGPKERQWKLTTEKDIMSILITSFMREFQENIEEEIRKDENQVLKSCQDHWTQVMNEVKSMQQELATLHERGLEDSDSSALSSPRKSSTLSSPTKSLTEEGSHDRFFFSNSSSQKVEELDKSERSTKEEENEDVSNFVSKLIKNHESIIRQKSEQLNWSKQGILQDKKGSSSKRRQELNILKEKIHSVTERLDNLINWNAKVSESLFNKRAIHDKETLPWRKLSEVYDIDTVRKDVDNWRSAWEKVNGVTNEGNEARDETRVLNIEKKYNSTLQSSISEDIYGSIDEGLREEFDSKAYKFDLEILIQEHVYKCYLREVLNQWNESIERYIIERKISDEGMREEFDNKAYKFDLEILIQEHVYKWYLREVLNQWNESIVERKISDEGLREEFDSKAYKFDLEILIQEHVYKRYLREVLNQWNESIERYIIERKISDDIYLIVFSETTKEISSNQEFSIAKCQGGESEEHCLQYSTSSDQFDEIERTVKDDICMLIFRETFEEFKKTMVDCNADCIVREDIQQIVFAETLKTFVNVASSASREHRDNNIQENFHDRLQSMIVETFVKEDICKVVFKVMVEEWKLELDNYYMENIVKEKIDRVIMAETLNDAFLSCVEVTSSVQDNNNIVEDNRSNVRFNQVQKVQGEETLTIILLESLLGCFEAEENLMLSAQSEIKEHSKTLDLGSERGDLHEHEIFEDLITGEEQTFSSLTSKVENVLQQLGISKALLRELGTSLGHRLRGSESFHNQMSANEECQLKLTSAFLPLLNVSQTFEEFEGMVCQKFEMMTVRLENMKSSLVPVAELVDCLRNKELLYQKAFNRRCQNLQIAEAEVDLLGDQVDKLLTLLEKIYVTLHHHAPELQQYLEVSNILELIRKELISGAVQVASIVT
ncbi:hypothetical protein RIF29_18468 [Crotalaria pallida]|uniref:WPP domain-associated protein n=1 Tax=Crotalaria pallida TaxID=3830 RepID=A0AAN9FIW1_CROPI